MKESKNIAHSSDFNWKNTFQVFPWNIPYRLHSTDRKFHFFCHQTYLIIWGIYARFWFNNSITHSLTISIFVSIIPTSAWPVSVSSRISVISRSSSGTATTTASAIRSSSVFTVWFCNWKKSVTNLTLPVTSMAKWQKSRMMPNWF